jgi:hypothetical protein
MGGHAQKTGRETSGDLADQLPRTCLLSEALLGQFPHIGHPNNVETIPENHPRGVAPGEGAIPERHASSMNPYPYAVNSLRDIRAISAPAARQFTARHAARTSDSTPDSRR